MLVIAGFCVWYLESLIFQINVEIRGTVSVTVFDAIQMFRFFVSGV